MNKAKLSAARELQAAGKRKEALAIYETLLKEDPKNAELLHLVGVLYAQLNEPSRALTYIQSAIKEEPSAPLYNSLGNVLRHLGKPELAIEALQKSISLKSDYAPAYNNLGLIYYQQKKYSEAKIAYKKALSITPDFMDALFNEAILEAHLGELKAAQEKLESLFEKNPDNSKVIRQLAEVYLGQGHYRKALSFFDEQLKKSPEDAEIYYSIGLCLLKSEEYSDAIKSFETALSLHAKAEELYHNLATAYLHSKDPEKALTYYLRQLEHRPMIETYYNIGVLLMDKNRFKEAITYLEHAAALDPKYLPTHINLGALYLRQKHLAKAITHYQMAQDLKPDDPEIGHILAALKKDQTPDAAPKEYLQHLFDQYARIYDTHLTQQLNYQVPEKMYARIFEEIGVEKPLLQILDLGCGTGLCGTLFRPMAKKLIGIDLSENMLAQAKEKNVYDELVPLEATLALEKYQHNDVILAADVFTYIGNLEIVFKRAYEALNTGGLFAFSVEKTLAEPYELQHSIRYAHSKKYLEHLIAQDHFTVLGFHNLILRKQHQQEVEGYLILLKK